MATNHLAVSELNRLLWQQGGLLSHAQGWGGDIKVLSIGSEDAATSSFRGAQIDIDGKVYRGTIFFTYPGMGDIYSNDAILQISSAAGSGVWLDCGEAVREVVLTPHARIMDFYLSLAAERHNTQSTSCSRWISSMPDAKRVHALLRFFMERSQRKYDQIIQIWKQGQYDWNHVMYVQLLTAIGGSAFKKPYSKLASLLPYSAIAHEKDVPGSVEALMLGSSGLLQLREKDEYIVKLRKLFDEYLCRKYNIMPMVAGEWMLEQTRHYNSPVLRMVQLAGFLSTKEFIFDSIRQCRTPEDIYTLFRAEVPHYWSEQFCSGKDSGSVGRMGRATMDVMGINFIVPLMFAYSASTRDEQLRHAAQNLIEAIPCESNRPVNLWRTRGVNLANSCDSQAILELNNEYCGKSRCYSCPICRQLIKKELGQIK